MAGSGGAGRGGLRIVELAGWDTLRLPGRFEAHRELRVVGGADCTLSDLNFFNNGRADALLFERDWKVVPGSEIGLQACVNGKDMQESGSEHADQEPYVVISRPHSPSVVEFARRALKLVFGVRSNKRDRVEE